MKKLAILVLVLTSFTSVFAMSEKSDVVCSKINQSNGDKEAPASTSAVSAPATGSIKR